MTDEVYRFINKKIYLNMIHCVLESSITNSVVAISASLATLYFKTWKAALEVIWFTIIRINQGSLNTEHNLDFSPVEDHRSKNAST
jgi:hypothetical protein